MQIQHRKFLFVLNMNISGGSQAAVSPVFDLWSHYAANYMKNDTTVWLLLKVFVEMSPTSMHTCSHLPSSVSVYLCVCVCVVISCFVLS